MEVTDHTTEQQEVSEDHTNSPSNKQELTLEISETQNFDAPSSVPEYTLESAKVKPFEEEKTDVNEFVQPTATEEIHEVESLPVIQSVSVMYSKECLEEVCKELSDHINNSETTVTTVIVANTAPIDVTTVSDSTTTTDVSTTSDLTDVVPVIDHVHLLKHHCGSYIDNDSASLKAEHKCDEEKNKEPECTQPKQSPKSCLKKQTFMDKNKDTIVKASIGIGAAAVLGGLAFGVAKYLKKH